MNQSPTKDTLLLLAFLFSGITALGFEILWTRLLSLALGGEVLAVLGVLTGFFGGMVIGALTMSRKVNKVKNPVTIFLILEVIIILYGIISPHLIFGLSDVLPPWLGPVAGDNASSIALLVTILSSGIILIPATFGMGANFAFLVEARRRAYSKAQGLSSSVGRLYAANTLGATIGIMITIYFLMPQYGFEVTAILLGSIGMLSLLSAYTWSKKNKQDATPIDIDSMPTDRHRPYLHLLILTGFLTIGLEINAIHILKQILQNTIFTFGNILAVYLVGTSLGAWLYHKLIKRKKYKSFLSAERLFNFQVISIVIMMMVLHQIDHLMQIFQDPEGIFFYNILAEIFLAVAVFLIPTIIMGAIFTMLISANDRTEVGKGYGLNILGSTLAPFVFGLLLIPLIGSYRSIFLIGVGYMGIILYGQLKLGWPSSKVQLIALIAGLVVMSIFRPMMIKLPEGWEVLEYKEGMMGATVVSELPGQTGPFGLPMKILQVNNRFRMGGGAGFLEKRMGSLPLLLQPQIDKALYLGLGTGTTLGMAKHINIGHIDAVEIVPEVKDVLPLFTEHHQGIFSADNVTYHTSDARRYIRASKDQYDLIVGDLFHPARDGAGLLFTLNHFGYLSDHLTENGLVVQWLPIYQFDEENLKTVIRSFLQVFPETHAFLGGYNANLPAMALVAKKGSLSVDYKHLETLLVPGNPIQQVYENPSNVIASYMMGPKKLKSFCGDGPLNTDQHPVVLFEAPKSVYKKEINKALDNMIFLIQFRSEYPSELWTSISPSSTIKGKQAWLSADYFIKGNIEKVKSGNTPSTLNNYFNAYKTDPDFSPARGELFQTAIQDPNARNSILTILNERDRKRLQSILNNGMR